MSTGNRTYGVRELANWILDFADARSIKLSNMALNKLVYFAYEHALLHHGRKLTNAKIEAWEHGPVFREVYRSFSHFGSKPINQRATQYNAAKDIIEIATPNIREDDQVILEEAIGALAHLPAAILRDISHASGGPWSATWHHEDTTNPGMHISDDVILSNHPKRRQ